MRKCLTSFFMESNHGYKYRYPTLDNLEDNLLAVVNICGALI